MSDATWLRDVREVAEAKVARGERMMSVNPAVLIEVIDELEQLRERVRAAGLGAADR